MLLLELGLKLGSLFLLKFLVLGVRSCLLGHVQLFFSQEVCSLLLTDHVSDSEVVCHGAE